MALQLRRGTNAERAAETFAVGELIYTTDTKQIYVGDGSTQGGVLVSSSAASSPASLTQNLSLNGFNISGTGNISATAFVGDGSGLTGIASGAGVEEGQEYAIDIQGNVRGDDTTVLVDAALGRVSADHYGDGSNLTGITLNQLTNVDTTGVTTNSILKYDGADWVIGVDGGGGGGLANVVEDTTPQLGGNLDLNSNNITGSGNIDLSGNITATAFSGYHTGDTTGSVFGDDSTLLVDGINSKIVGPVETSSLVVEPDSGENQVVFKALDNSVKVFNQRESNTDLSGYSGLLGEWQFATQGTDGFKSRAVIQGYHTSLIIAASDGSYAYPAETLNNVTATGVSLGGITPAQRLDVRGNAIVEGWIQTGSLTTTERNALTAANGMLLYNSTDSVFQVYENGAWVAMRDGTGGGGGGGASSFTNIGISADDSAVRLINEGESVGILGGTAITTASDAEGNITITGVAQDFAFGSITGTPTTLAGYGITDAATSAQGALADSAVQPATLGNFTFTSSVLDSSDSSGITVTPAVTVSSDLTVENNLTVTNTVTADRFVATGTETPEISASANLNLTAGNAVVLTSSPLRLASFTTTERNALAAQNGDIVYNTTDNKFQGYENGAWANLI